MTEAQLIEGLKNGDEACFKYLYKYYIPDVKRYILKNSGDEDNAKDMFQEAVIALLGNLRSGKYAHQNNLKGYFLRIVRNKWLDRIDRGEADDTPLINEPVGEDKPFEFPGLTLGKYLKQALQKLGDPCKSLIIATVVLKKRMERAALDFGYADAHSARQQKLRCLKKLRELIDPQLLMGLI